MTLATEQIAYNIKFFREQNNWTQKELANKLLLSRSVVAKWESNATMPDITTLLKLSNVFNVTLDHLVGNYSFQNDLLKEFKRIYSSTSKSFDVEVVELIEYLMTHPNFKNYIYRLKNLPLKRQQSIHKLFHQLIEQYEQT
ncbi:helix-turn-helix domain-containing protein [Virgibacillus sp. W0430]|uniref:helix-turn-helix domain-containing protein n=1 Tax=Virgibacillus sp. W0430 TaxID=3391580 RepID=UPI003F463489